MVTPLLTDEDLDNINAAIDMAGGLEEDFLRAEQAGLDITANRTRLETTVKRLRQVKSAFFPNR